MPAMVSVPCHASAWLTADMVSGLLDRSLLPDPSSLVSLAISPIHGGQTAEVLRIFPCYRHPVASAPERLIAKVPRAFYRDDAIRDRMYQNERNFYLNVPVSCQGITPRLLNRDQDRVHGSPAVLLLEDLGPRTGAGDLQGCTHDDVMAAVAAVARVHRTTVAVRARFPMLTEGVAALAAFYRESWRLVREDATVSIPPAAMRLGEALVWRLSDVRYRLADYPPCLIHGDFHAENLFFGNPGQPDTIRLVDWQFASQGPGLLDVVYLLCWGCRTETRRTVTSHAVAQYLALSGSPACADREVYALIAWCTAFVMARAVNLLAQSLLRMPADQVFARKMFERTALAWEDMDADLRAMVVGQV